MEASPAEITALQTRTIWELFSKFSDEELDTLLTAAGVSPMEDRGFKLHAALVVWFHGSIPNLLEVEKLAMKEFDKDKNLTERKT